MNPITFSTSPSICSQVRVADSLRKTAWKRLDRSVKGSAGKTERAKRANIRKEIVEANGYKNQRLAGESYAELEYRPTAFEKTYRMVVVRKDIDVNSG